MHQLSSGDNERETGDSSEAVGLKQVCQAGAPVPGRRGTRGPNLASLDPTPTSRTLPLPSGTPALGGPPSSPHAFEVQPQGAVPG